MTRSLAVSIAVLFAACSGWMGLPPVPDSLTAREAGLEGIEGWGATAARLALPLNDGAAPADPVDRFRLAVGRISSGQVEAGLAELGKVVEERPDDVVIGNRFRMEVYRLHREFLSEAKARGERMPLLPGYLRDEPLATLRRVAEAHPSREVRLQIALAHVDRMVLNPALEIRAPASVDSVRAFTEILEADPYHVPALLGRGLNHMNRPRNLVWPEHPPPPPNAGSTDVALAVAVGARVGGAPERVKAMLLMLLGDAYAHEGQVGQARSWWAVAAGTGDDPEVRRQLSLRASWRDAEAPDRLDARLAERMEDADHPVSDLSFLWDASARGPS